MRSSEFRTSSEVHSDLETERPVGEISTGFLLGIVVAHIRSGIELTGAIVDTSRDAEAEQRLVIAGIDLGFVGCQASNNRFRAAEGGILANSRYFA